jgi:hypothetical protein
MGQLIALWDQYIDPDDPTNGYTPYSFVPTGHQSAANMSLSRDWGRRESVVSVPGLDSVLDQFGKLPGPMDRADVTFSFTVLTNGDNDAAEDLLRAQVAPGYPQRLVYRTDSGGLWFTLGSNPRIKQSSAAANNWGGGGKCDFTVSWRIRPDWRPRLPSIVDTLYRADNSEVYAADNHEIYLAPGATLIAAAQQPFTMDATGTAGYDLPTLPDTGAYFSLSGPVGGDGGIIIGNNTATVTDTTGNRVAVILGIPFNLPTASDSCVLDLAAQTFTHNGAPFRPNKPAYQREYFRVQPGVVNQCYVLAVAGNDGQVHAKTGGFITRRFWKKKA